MNCQLHNVIAKCIDICILLHICFHMKPQPDIKTVDSFHSVSIRIRKMKLKEVGDLHVCLYVFPVSREQGTTRVVSARITAICPKTLKRFSVHQ